MCESILGSITCELIHLLVNGTLQLFALFSKESRLFHTYTYTNPKTKFKPATAI